MSPQVARWVSLLGHPFLLTPATAFAVAFRRGDPGRAGLTAAAVAAFLIVPVLGLIAMRVRSGAWSDFDVSAHAERRRLYRQLAVVLPVGMALAWLLRPELRPGIVAGCALLIASAAANRFLKSSLHVAFAAFCAVLLAAGLVSAVLALAGVALVAWSRMSLGRHTAAEVVSGALLGATAGLALLKFG